MSSFEEITAVAFQIIASVGSARSCYIEAIHAARDHDFDRAQACIEEGNKAYSEGHDAHMGLLQQEAAGTPTEMGLILTHAEDQLMSAESFGILANEFIDVYRTLGN